ncbi:progranulin-like [Aplochiton taeniatus]
MREKVPAQEANALAVPPAAPAPALVVPEASPVHSRAEARGKGSVVYCDGQTVCPDGTTCCRHPKGPWFCCPYSPGKCCLDGYHCCPYGYDCDFTYTHCIRQGLRYPFTPKLPAQVVPASFVSESQVQEQEVLLASLTQAEDSGLQKGVIRCDDLFYCQPGNSCCKGPTGKWSCCPYTLGKCCSDGMHCCEYGYTCDPSSMQCRKWST